MSACAGAASSGAVISKPAWTMNLAQAAPMPSVWNVLMMSSVAARW